jgi:ATP-dependent Clp protease adaptor protein ClpS
MAETPQNLPEGDVKNEQEIREPKMYRVILHNDNYSTMDFVIEVLISIFHKPAADATRIMLDVHKKGMGICGVYTYDIAATRVARVHRLAKKREFPLKCSLEEA